MDHSNNVPWGLLTRSPQKVEAYGQDLYFREGWADMLEAAGDRLADTLHRTTFLMLKPDAIAGRRGRQVVDFVVGHGFRPLGAAPVTLGRHAQRAVWQYDWHVYTPDRLEFSTFWYSTCPLLVIALEDTLATEPSRLPASVRLSTLKGSADPRARNPEQLRSVLATPNSILNFVHVTDEPADIAREIGILWPAEERRAAVECLLTALRAGSTVEVGRQAVLDVLKRMEDAIPAHDLDVEMSLQRLEARGKAPAGLREVIEVGGLAGRPLLSRLLASDGDRWDVITLGSAVVEYERAGYSGLLPGTDVNAWSD